MRRFQLSGFAVFAATLVIAHALHAQPADRAQRPAIGPPPALVLPPLQQFTLGNGLTVLLMEKHEVPVVDVRFVTRAGSVNDPGGAAGLASLTADLMDEGAGPYSALELADALDFLGARLTTDAGYHSTEVHLATPLSKLDAALPLMADVVLRPTFADSEVARLKALRLTGFTQQRDEPRALAALAFDRALYGADHPYGRATDGDSAGIAALGRADVQRFYQAHFAPAQSALIVVGDVSRADVEARLNALFGGWTAAASAAPAPVPAPRQVARTRVILVDKPGAAQSVVRIGRIGAAQGSPDTYTLEVLNTLLGGSFTSRLNQNLRERNGYTYGAGSSFDLRPVAGPFTASADVQTAVTGPALQEFFNEFRAIGVPVEEAELARARSYRALSFPRPFATAGGTSAMLSRMWMDGLTPDYFTGFTGRVMGVSPRDFQQAARRYVDPKQLVVVVVGDRATIEKDVRALKLGPVEVLTVDDVMRGPR